MSPDFGTLWLEIRGAFYEMRRIDSLQFPRTVDCSLLHRGRDVRRDRCRSVMDTTLANLVTGLEPGEVHRRMLDALMEFERLELTTGRPYKASVA